jgi:hypothetical protein
MSVTRRAWTWKSLNGSDSDRTRRLLTATPRDSAVTSVTRLPAKVASPNKRSKTMSNSFASYKASLPPHPRGKNLAVILTARAP